MHIKEDSHVEIIRYSDTHCISHTHILLDAWARRQTMTHVVTFRENKSLALLWVPTRVLALILTPRNHTFTQFGLRYLRAWCGFRSGTWTTGSF